MRKILLLLLLIGSTFSVKAQLFGADWQEGYYYDLSGEKHTGLIANYIATKSILGIKGNSFVYKPDKKAKKQIIKAGDIQAFIVKHKQKDTTICDSFVVAKTKEAAEAPFMLVKLNKNPVKLYSLVWNMASAPAGGGVGGLTFSAGVGGSGETYYWGSGPDNITKLTKKNYTEAISQILADKPDIVAKIKDKTYGWDYRHTIIEFYLTGQWNPPY